jgi:hypothetical protein
MEPSAEAAKNKRSVMSQTAKDIVFWKWKESRRMEKTGLRA